MNCLYSALVTSRDANSNRSRKTRCRGVSLSNANPSPANPIARTPSENATHFDAGIALLTPSSGTPKEGGKGGPGRGALLADGPPPLPFPGVPGEGNEGASSASAVPALHWRYAGRIGFTQNTCLMSVS